MKCLTKNPLKTLGAQLQPCLLHNLLRLSKKKALRERGVRWRGRLDGTIAIFSAGMNR